MHYLRHPLLGFIPSSESLTIYTRSKSFINWIGSLEVSFPTALAVLWSDLTWGLPPSLRYDFRFWLTSYRLLPHNTSRSCFIPRTPLGFSLQSISKYPIAYYSHSCCLSCCFTTNCLSPMAWFTVCKHTEITASGKAFSGLHLQRFIPEHLANITYTIVRSYRSAQ